MTLNLELESLENIIKDFYNVTHIRSSIYDGNYSKILSYPKEHSPICSIMHNNDKTKAFCSQSNRNAFEQCKNCLLYTSDQQSCSCFRQMEYDPSDHPCR